MTKEARIAIALLGWKESNDPIPAYGDSPEGRCLWPTFATLDECRKFEDVLWGKYTNTLYEEYKEALYRESTFDSRGNSFLRAIPAERKEACFNVIEKNGL